MNNKNFWKDLFLVVLGNFILAFGVAFFIVPLDILSGGVAGVAVAIAPIVPIDTNYIIYFLTVFLFILGAVMLGKNFAIKTLLSAILYPVFIAILTPMTSKLFITGNLLLAAIYAGVSMGVGVGLVFRTGASTGGMDVPPLIIHKLTGIKVTYLILIVDGLTVLLGMTINGIEAAMIGLISVYISSVMVDKTMMLGIASEKSLMIISEKYEQMIEEINKDLERGSTIISAKGGYKGEDRPILMVAISKKQFPALNRIIQSVDPNAFVIVHDVNDVLGEGFTFTEDERKETV